LKLQFSHYLINQNSFKINKSNKKQINQNFYNNSSQLSYNQLPNYFFNNIFFTARADKGLSRFYEQNKDVMPKSVKKYIDNLPSKNITPIEAHYNAFEGLEIAENIYDVKSYYKKSGDIYRFICKSNKNN